MSVNVIGRQGCSFRCVVLDIPGDGQSGLLAKAHAAVGGEYTIIPTCGSVSGLTMPARTCAVPLMTWPTPILVWKSPRPTLESNLMSR